jgi:hypothetical protein
MFDQLSAEIVPSLTKGRHNNNNNNKAKCIPGGTLRVLAGKNAFRMLFSFPSFVIVMSYYLVIFLNMQKLPLHC